MATQKLLQLQDKRNVEIVEKEKQSKIDFVDKKFSISKGINQMYALMQEITSKEMSVSTVHAACECLGKINETMRTTVDVARFLSEE